ncbi:MAG: AAA family ATPase [Candidatus Omnitrophica bacterium]|nr:AAA family ATPase [Candidatus Omnitrophota bacterium]
MAKKIFIAATYQNVGKTTVSIGLLAHLQKTFRRIGFIKPIGQRYLMEHGYKVDEDSVLIEKIFSVCNTNIKDLSPIAVEPGFTEKYITGNANSNYKRDIVDAYRKISRDKDLVVIEGTGHAGVGSVFDLSNATVARLLGAKVILIAPGGVGRPIDEVLLNKALFDKCGVRLAGVIVNKVLTEKFNKINKLVRDGFRKQKIPIIGVMPYQKRLDIPTFREIMEELKVALICGDENIDVPVDKILIGAMEVTDALKYLENNTLVITPSDRIDLLNAVIKTQAESKERHINKISGVVLTGDMEPNTHIIDELAKLEIPTVQVKTDTFTATKRICDIVVKVKPEDTEKIRLIRDMVEKYVDFDLVMKNLT